MEIFNIEHSLLEYKKLLVVELEKIIEIFNRPTADFSTSSYNSQQEAVADIHSIIKDIKSGDVYAIDRVPYIFSTHSGFEKIAQKSGFMNEYNKIEHAYASLIGSIRQAEKRDKNIYGDAFNANSQSTNHDSYASNPGRLQISEEKWQAMIKLSRWGFFKKRQAKKVRPIIQEYMLFGDTQPALVMNTNPLLVAPYSSDLDAVVLLYFPKEYVELYNLKKYDRLISVNTYGTTKAYDDIIFGPNMFNSWSEMFPNIGEFLSDDLDKIKKHKENIPEATWDYVKKLADEYVIRYKGLPRDAFWFVR
ncbi:MAG: hypothetical protein FWE13_00165 [Firmicutes bacterium]|nr:hypothetical protein [Bacillota bacterium]